MPAFKTWPPALVLSARFFFAGLVAKKRRSLADFEGMPVLLNFCAPTEKHSQKIMSNS